MQHIVKSQNTIFLAVGIGLQAELHFWKLISLPPVMWH